MKLPQKLQQLATRLRQLPKKYVVLFLVGLVVIFYGVAFFLPRPVEFSYASDSCVRQLTLLPGLQKTVDESAFKASYQNELKISLVPLLALKTCFTPTETPKEGSSIVAVAPFGSVVARKHYSLAIPASPTANIAALKPVPTTKPLEVALSAEDRVHEYEMAINKKTTSCKADDQAISCDIVPLKLRQGVAYDFELQKKFDGELTEAKKGELTTLKAVTIKKTSVKNNQTVYSKPKSFTLKTDKMLKSADVIVERMAKKPVQTDANVSVKDKTITVTVDKNLARETKYRLTVKSAEATDESTLTEPRRLTFTMSGGPKVTGVSIGATKVDHSAQAIVRFDQALSDADVKKFVSFKGGSASISKLSASSVAVTLQNLPRCQDFSIRVAKGIKSKYGIVANDTWQHSARTTCHTVSTYGTSQQGRPLQAYTFGNSGPATLYVGAIHGNEVSSSLILQDWIDWLEQKGKDLPSNRRIVVVPTANPDGVAAGTRNNSRDVNLNRNFPTSNWEKNIDDTDGMNKGGGGSKPLSEPEAQALANLSSSLRPRLLLSYHAVGSLVIGDPGGYSAPYAAKYASMVGYQNATGQESDTFDYSITGSYEDWTIKNMGIPSMIIELGSYSYRDFNHHQSAMWTMLQ